MCDYDAPKIAPEGGGTYHAFHHCEFWVGNAKQAAAYYCARFGFNMVAYRGLETGSREVASYVVGQGDIKFCFTSSITPKDPHKIGARVAVRGDGVKVVAFSVDKCKHIYEKAIKRGGKSVSEPELLKDDHGSVWVASIQTYGDTVHTFVEDVDYKGCFLPGFQAITEPEPLSVITPSVGLKFIDHIVGNQPEDQMMPVVEFYEKVLEFHRFWSVDDKQMCTEYSALRSVVMASFEEKVKMPINEPAPGLRKSQIQEFVEFFGGDQVEDGGAGVQHIAMHTDDIITTVTHLRARGLEFLKVPATYYEDLKKRLAKSDIKVKEDLDKLQELCILVDFDDKGYLLQIFTVPLQCRPCLFTEIIQRAGNSGFGIGNFKALFESIERAQALRGNL